MDEQQKPAIPDGYRQWEEIDPFEHKVGPFYFGRDADGVLRGAVLVEQHHLNLGNMIHGGFLMTFADFAMFVTARDVLDTTGGMAVTVAFNSEFVSAGRLGPLLRSEGSITRATRSLIFVRGRLFQGDETVLAYSGILKKLNR